MRHVLIFALFISIVSACEATDPTEDPTAGTSDTSDATSSVDTSATGDTSGSDTVVDPSDATPPTPDGTPGGTPDGTPEPDAGPQGCTSDADCGPGEICEVNSGTCLADSGCDDQCDLGDVGCTNDVAWACVNGLSGCTELSETDCALQSQTCFAGLCIAGNGDPDCKSDLDCQANETCVDGDCMPSGNGSDCTTGLDCLDGQECVAGVCVNSGGNGGGGDASCVGICGSQADSGCWCDSGCSNFGDCCDDYGPVCDNCVPSCDGKECGGDGCGGTCGSCEGNVNGMTVCDPANNTCADPSSFPGNTCEAAVFIDPGALPFKYVSTTAVLSNSYAFTAGACPGETVGMGGASPDQVFELNAVVGGIYTISVNADYDAALYAVSDCSDVDGTCLAAVDDFSDESFKVSLSAGEGIFIIVDGYSNTNNQGGTYTLDVSSPCIPSCDGKQCGDDGCGAQCGECDPADPNGNVQCDIPTAQCIAPVGAEGGFCATAPIITGADLPYEMDGNTEALGNFFSVDGTQCDGIASAKGGASSDAVYIFTPDTTGVYTITLDATFDSLLVVSEACSDVNGSCMQASDGLGVEEVTPMLTAGEKYTIVVDGWSNSSDLKGPYTLSIDEPCITSCDGKQCGDNGCGSACGACSPNDASAPTVCDATTFQCVDPATVAGATCADPIPVGELPYVSSGSTSGISNDFSFAAGSCDGETGGMGGGSADLVFRFTPEVSGIYDIEADTDFDAVLYAATDCAGIDASCLGASDNGNPEKLSLELNAGETLYLIVDGYSSSVDQSGDYSLSIAPPCIPSCDGKVCGNNGCGGFCGVCDPEDPAGNSLCDDTLGQCVSPSSIEGNTCDNPASIPNDSLPVVINGETTFMSNEYGSSDTGCGDGSSYGNASADSAFRFTAPSEGYYDFTLVGEFDSAIYVVKDCTDIDNTCLGQDDSGTGSPETVSPLLAKDETVYIIVDGWSSYSDGKGAFTLTVSPPCVPTCEGKQCGTDGCGGVCSECGEGEACFEFQCVDPSTLEGDSCENAITVGVLPWQTAGDSSYYGPDYGYNANMCPGESYAWGAGANDVAYRFTAPADATYTILLDATFDSNLYVVEDCSNVDGTCLGANEELGPEQLELPLTNGQTVFIIVDGYGTTSNQSGPYALSVTQN
jgi:hypothetical protein